MTPVSFEGLRRLGGALCLDFVNTVDPRYGLQRVEYIPDYESLVAWAAWAGAIEPPDRVAPRSGAAVLRRAHALRDDLHALLGPERPDPRALDAFNRELRRAAGHAVVRPAEDSYVAAWDTAARPDRVLWPIVRSAADLMLSPSLERVRECDGHNCGWLFLDTSKAGRRRWCSMEICGNRAKSQRHRRRVPGKDVGYRGVKSA
jgi:predicted RNA-binding Zn ribbon-like protein